MPLLPLESQTFGATLVTLIITGWKFPQASAREVPADIDKAFGLARASMRLGVQLPIEAAHAAG